MPRLRGVSREDQTNIIEHKDPGIQLTQTVRGDAVRGGVASFENHYMIDAKESSNKIGGREVKSISR